MANSTTLDVAGQQVNVTNLQKVSIRKPDSPRAR